jgi:hypothetical protein
MQRPFFKVKKKHRDLMLIDSADAKEAVTCFLKFSCIAMCFISFDILHLKKDQSSE